MDGIEEIVFETLMQKESVSTIIGILSKSLKRGLYNLEKQLKEEDSIGAGGTIIELKEISSILSDLDKSLNIKDN